MTTPADATAAAGAGRERDVRARVKGTNINEVSLLATDYLNHFNEIVMVLDLIPDMPEMLDEARAWRPRSYTEHFDDSTFSERALAIEAYDVAPADYRVPFEEAVKSLNRLVAVSIDRIARALEAGDRALVADTTAAASRALQRLMDIASAIINGNKPTIHQQEIDALLQE